MRVNRCFILLGAGTLLSPQPRQERPYSRIRIKDRSVLAPRAGMSHLFQETPILTPLEV